MGRFGPLRLGADGRRYHGDLSNHAFRIRKPHGVSLGRLALVDWDSHEDALTRDSEFCGHCNFVGNLEPGKGQYECLGHEMP